MRIFSFLIILLLSGLAQAQSLTLMFPNNTLITPAKAFGSGCEASVMGYTVDVSVAMTSNGTGCRPAALFPSGMINASKLFPGRSSASLLLSAPVGHTFDALSLNVVVYGNYPGSRILAVATYPDGTQNGYYLPYTWPAYVVPGVKNFTLPPQFSGISNLRLVSTTGGIELSNVVINDNINKPAVYLDHWIGINPQLGAMIPMNPYETTLNLGLIQELPSGTPLNPGTIQKVIYTSPALSFTLINPLVVLEGDNAAHPGVEVAHISGATNDQNGTPISVSITENFNILLNNGIQTTYAVAGGNLIVNY